MLWTLAFMKLYDSEAVLAAICRCDEKTFRKWVWQGVDVLGDLDLVRHVNVPVVSVAVSLVQQSIHLSTFFPLGKDKMDESIHARQWQYLPSHSRWNGL